MYTLVQYWISKSSWWQLCSNVLQSCSPISHSNISKSSFNTAQTRLCSIAIQCSNSGIKTKSKIAKKEEKERSKWAKSSSFSLRTFLSVSIILRIDGAICAESGASRDIQISFQWNSIDNQIAKNWCHIWWNIKNSRFNVGWTRRKWKNGKLIFSNKKLGFFNSPWLIDFELCMKGV